MKTLFFLLSSVVMLAITATGCSKDKEPAPSKTTLVSQQPWILRAYTVTRLSDGVVTDGYAPMSPCYRDDQYVFFPNKTYEGNAGATKCSPGDPQVFQTGTWRFTNGETKLEQTITTGTGIGTREYSITSLTATELKLQIEDGVQRHIVTYSH